MRPLKSAPSEIIEERIDDYNYDNVGDIYFICYHNIYQGNTVGLYMHPSRIYVSTNIYNGPTQLSINLLSV